MAEFLAASVRGQAVVRLTGDDDGDDSSPLSVPPPLVQLAIEVHFTIGSLALSCIQLVLLLAYLMIAMAAKLTVSVVLFPETALTLTTIFFFCWCCAQDTEMPQIYPEED
jgi:hypothetical protein